MRKETGIKYRPGEPCPPQVDPRFWGVFGRFLEDGTPKISSSQVNKILTCPEDWDRRYLRCLPEMTSIAMAFGTMMHSHMETVMRSWKLGQRPSMNGLAKSLQATTIQTFTDPLLINNLSDRDELDPDLLAYQAEAAFVPLHQWLVEHDVKPLRIEEELYRYITVEGVRVAVHCIPDLVATVDDVAAVLDYKFPNGKSPTQADDGFFLPTSSHSHAILNYVKALIDHDTDIQKAIVLCTPRPKTRKSSVRVCETPVTVSPQGFAWADLLNEIAVRKILHRDLGPNPLASNWKCKPKYCSHFHNCPGALSATHHQFQSEADKQRGMYSTVVDLGMEVEDEAA